jgi:hypothetical protein
MIVWATVPEEARRLMWKKIKESICGLHYGGWPSLHDQPIKIHGIWKGCMLALHQTKIHGMAGNFWH